MHEIREYQARTDAEGLRRCFIEMQDYIRRFELSMPPGEVAVDAYLQWILERCASYDGTVFVAADAGEVVGFVCVWARVPPNAPDEDPGGYAYISDLAVTSAFRRRGIGRELLARAEAYARSRGATTLRIGVLAKNEGPYRLYRACGFTDRHIDLSKNL